MASRSGGSHVEGPADVLTRQTGIHCPPPAVGPVTHQSAISPSPGEDGFRLDGLFRVLLLLVNSALLVFACKPL